MVKNSKLKPWKIHSSSYILKDKWLALRADKCETSQGVIVDPYYIIEFSDWADIVAFDEDMNLLLIKQYRHAVGEVVYELPGGIIESDNPLESAEHELREETGYVSAQMSLLSSHYPNPAKFTNQTHAFLALECKLQGEQELEAAEEIEVEKFSIPDALELIESGQMKQAYHISEIYLALRKLKLLSLTEEF